MSNTGNKRDYATQERVRLERIDGTMFAQTFNDYLRSHVKSLTRTRK